MSTFITGAQMYSVRTHTQTEEDLRATLKRIKEMGYNAVQLSGQSRDIPMERIRDMLDEFELDCGATHISFQEMEEDLDTVIRRHRLWKCKYPGVGAMPFQMGSTLEGFQAFIQRVNPIAERLQDAGLNFIYHNHAFEFQKFNGKPGMEVLLESFSPAVQFELDVYWVQAGGADPLDWIHRVRGRMDVVHFKEMVGHLPTEEDHSMTRMAPVGEGNMNWPKIIAACDEIGVKYAFVEQDNAVEAEDPLNEMRISHDNLVKFGARF